MRSVVAGEHRAEGLEAEEVGGVGAARRACVSIESISRRSGAGVSAGSADARVPRRMRMPSAAAEGAAKAGFSVRHSCSTQPSAHTSAAEAYGWSA